MSGRRFLVWARAEVRASWPFLAGVALGALFSSAGAWESAAAVYAVVDVALPPGGAA
ncbi:hypothetical protein ABZ820_12690 [Streptomyces diacarni]|uniref:hypothetical protein n=1 Tax=Streptomyces diacarni TaxID=2800381 RepID=UPI0033E96DBC